MLRIYRWNGATFQFEEGEQPEGAVPVDAAPPKAVKATDKARRPANKKRASKKKE